MNNTYETYYHHEFLNDQLPRAFSDNEFIDGKLWISNLESGLHTFDNNLSSAGDYISSEVEDSLKIQSFSVNKIFYDKKKQQTLLSTIGDGLFIYSNSEKKFINHFTQKDGLLSNNIIDSKFGDKFIWVLTNKGLNYFDPKEGFMYLVDQNNGLNVLVFNEEPLSVNIKESIEEDDFGFTDNQNDSYLDKNIPLY